MEDPTPSTSSASSTSSAPHVWRRDNVRYPLAWQKHSQALPASQRSRRSMGIQARGYHGIVGDRLWKLKCQLVGCSIPPCCADKYQCYELKRSTLWDFVIATSIFLLRLTHSSGWTSTCGMRLCGKCKCKLLFSAWISLPFLSLKPAFSNDKMIVPGHWPLLLQRGGNEITQITIQRPIVLIPLKWFSAKKRISFNHELRNGLQSVPEL